MNILNLKKTLKTRLAFIDFLKILGIVLVTFQHISSHDPLLYSQYTISFNLWNMYQFDWGNIGVVLFLFASGLGLANSNLEIDSWKEVKEFYRKRFLRIYPVYYLSIIFSIIIQPNIFQQTFTPLDIIKMIFGMQALGARTETEIYGKINGPLWFITPLVLLYILFPILAYAIKKRPHISIIAIFIINQISLYLFSISNLFFGANWWFPLCVVFEFGLGIYLIKLRIYPKMQSRNQIIIILSKITFYIYLVNAPLLVIADYPLLYITSLLIIGSVFYAFDSLIRKILFSLS